MPGRTFSKAIAVWFVILLVAVLNGALRDRVLASVFGPVAARALSGIVLCVAILAAATVSARWLGTHSNRSRWHIGALWLFLTLVFEVAVGYAQHQSWQRLLDAYTFEGGNLWPLVLATIVVAPWAGARIRRIA